MFMHGTYRSMLEMLNDLDIILENGDKLFKSLNMFRILGVNDLPARVSIYDSSGDIVFIYLIPTVRMVKGITLKMAGQLHSQFDTFSNLE